MCWFLFFMEEIVEVLKTVFQEQISEKICKQIGDVHVPRAVEQVTEVPKISSRDRTLQCTAEQILDVLVPEMSKQLVQVPKTISRDEVQQRTVEQIVDAPVPQALHGFLPGQDTTTFWRADHRTISLAGKIIEMPVTRKAQQVANTLVQHDVNTVEVEKPNIIDETVQKPTIQEKINQVTKHIKVPQVQFWDKADRLMSVLRARFRSGHGRVWGW